MPSLNLWLTCNLDPSWVLTYKVAKSTNPTKFATYSMKDPRASACASAHRRVEQKEQMCCTKGEAFK